ncbi:hypothetical protein E2C01_017595 [Portunus trituberculatus]|uniref:Uncharacterized protein n=1 Tax=Portunus trituberculatus TaxID=210409 RepID=A0A5B7DS73_PORTR|nr:hypothetical protein [Portunus trituberculatus]
MNVCVFISVSGGRQLPRTSHLQSLVARPPTSTTPDTDSLPHCYSSPGSALSTVPPSFPFSSIASFSHPIKEHETLTYHIFAEVVFNITVLLRLASSSS